MRSIWSGTLVVGQVSIPVGLFIAAARDGTGFRLLHRPCGTPITQKRRCPTCDIDVPTQADIVSAAEFATGQYVTFDEGELAEALGSKHVKLDRFIQASEIPPEYIERTLWVTPSKDIYAETAYAALRTALDEAKLAGLGQIVLNQKEQPCLVSTHADHRVMILQPLFLPSQVRSPGDTWKRIAAIELSDQLLQTAREMVESRRYLTFRTTRLTSWFAPKLPAIIQRKVEGGKHVSVPEPNVAAPRDLEDALKRSVRRVKRKVPT